MTRTARGQTQVMGPSVDSALFLGSSVVDTGMCPDLHTGSFLQPTDRHLPWSPLQSQERNPGPHISGLDCLPLNPNIKFHKCTF